VGLLLPPTTSPCYWPVRPIVLSLVPRFPPSPPQLGHNRDCFVVDGASSEPRVMAMFRFLGKLMGVAIRTKVRAASRSHALTRRLSLLA